MKKRILSILIMIGLITAFVPVVSQAAITPYFIAINDTILPFNDDTMPYVTGGETYVPTTVFEGLGVWAIGSDDLEFVRLYRGVTRYVDFYTARRTTEDQDGNALFWPYARRVGSRFYVPLRQVCDYFDLTYTTIDIPPEVIPDQQMQVIRIMSSGGYSFNGPTLVGLRRTAIRAAFNEYFASSQPPPNGSATNPTPPPVEPPPDLSDVAIYLSFFDISAGSVGGILDLLDIQAASGYHACFFVSAADIAEEPDLIRRISGSGHTIGIWLSEGSYEEYQKTSVLLFEAAKIKTVIVSAGEAAETAIETASGSGLVFWESTQSLIDYDTKSVTSITEAIPQEGGARMNLLFSCSENAASTLPGVYAFLRTNEYKVIRITETVEPIV